MTDARFKILIISILLSISGKSFSQVNVEFNLDSIEATDSINTNLPDSLVMLEEERFNELNSGKAIVEEAEVTIMFDALSGIEYFGKDYITTDRDKLNVYGYDKDYVPEFGDSTYIQCIDWLAQQTTMPLTYNMHVKSFIELYAIRKRGLTSRMLGLSYVYFPMFEQMLDKYNLPLELKYLAMVESALNPTAGSRAGAKGLWQFMYQTGKIYKLNVTSLVDDRFDPLKETEAACQYLRDMYDLYGDWFLVLASYNCGAGNVNKAIQRAGGVKNYWAIWPFLPKETRGYVPAFIAVCYVMNFSSMHNIYPTNPGLLMNGTDTVRVKNYLSFEQLNEKIGVPITDLQFFNPQYIKNVIPANANNTYVLRLPNQYVSEFVNNEDSIYAYKTKSGIDQEKIAEEVKKVSDRTVHVVKKGESLGSIAKRYKTTTTNIKRWNGMKKDMIHPGQRLTIYTSGAPMAVAGNPKPVMRSDVQKKHTVAAGETLSSIAKKYKCTATDIKEWNNLKNTNIFVGQKLKVYPPAADNDDTQSKVSGDYVTYKVKKGDTLWGIAQKFDGVTVEQIKKLNNLGEKGVQTGQTLKIQKVK